MSSKVVIMSYKVGDDKTLYAGIRNEDVFKRYVVASPVDRLVR